MPQAGTFGINFDEIMMIASAITILLAIIPPMTNPSGINPLDFPGSFVISFNTLWFNNFAFFKSNEAGSCIGVLNSTATANIGPSLTVYNNTAYQENRSLLDEFLYKANLELNVWARGTPTISNTPIRTGVDIFQSGDALGAFISTITNLIGLVFKVIFDCTLGAFRLVIGLAIACYWFLKTIPLWQLLFQMFMAFIG
jgi:hypothetical protein